MLRTGVAARSPTPTSGRSRACHPGADHRGSRDQARIRHRARKERCRASEIGDIVHWRWARDSVPRLVSRSCRSTRARSSGPTMRVDVAKRLELALVVLSNISLEARPRAAAPSNELATGMSTRPRREVSVPRQHRNMGPRTAACHQARASTDAPDYSSWIGQSPGGCRLASDLGRTYHSSMSDRDLASLVARARSAHVTPSQREEHRRSFAFGNLSIENPRVTRELVERIAIRVPAPLPDE